MDPVLSSVLKKTSSTALARMIRWVVGWLAGFRTLQALYLRRYQQQLGERYGTFHPLAGRAEGPLNMRDRYVPLQVEDAVARKRTSIAQAIEAHRHLIVVAEPGAGKSMLLRHLAFEFAEGGRLARKANIPVVVQLQRLEDIEGQLDGYLVSQLGKAGFLRPEKFVPRLLRRGKLRVLLDGLDEVHQAHRARVVRQIVTFTEEYPGCEVVVTCRRAVREEALWAVMHLYEVVELDDQLIREFVRRSLETRQASVDLLLRSLFGAPRVLALARIPLLLALMVRMLGDGEQTRATVPASRAQFYREATRFLLTPFHGEASADPERSLDKRKILRALALDCQDSNDVDPWSIDRDQAYIRVEKLLRESKAEAQKLLSEITERSGLLSGPDDGPLSDELVNRPDDTYWFTHLTFQEYFAAEALRDDAKSILQRLRSNPDRWRETILLWCGIAKDARYVVEGLLQDRSLVALECLSEVQTIDQQLIERIIEAFQSDLDDADRDGQVVRAFGAAASGDCGSLVFDFLERTMANGSTPQRRAAAAFALAASHLPRAAAVLAKCHRSSPAAPRALERMGDFAVDVIASSVEHPDYGLIDGLVATGTPTAVHALVGLMWKEDQHVATYAAWQIATMVREPWVREALKGTQLTEEQRPASNFLWVWQLVKDPPIIGTIMSQVAYLLKLGPTSIIPEVGPRIDTDLAVALGFIACGRAINGTAIRRDATSIDKQIRRIVTQMSTTLGSKLNYDGKLTDKLLQSRSDTDWTQLQGQFFELHLRRMNWTERDRRLLSHVPPAELAKYFRMYQFNAPTESEWRHRHTTGPGLWPAIIGLFALAAGEGIALVTLTVVWTARTFFLPSGFTLEPLIQALPFLDWVAEFWYLGPLLVLGLVWLATRRRSTGYVLWHTAEISLWIVIVLVAVLLVIMPTAWLHGRLGSWWAIVGVWLVVLAVPAVGYALVHRQRARDANPLRNI